MQTLQETESVSIRFDPRKAVIELITLKIKSLSCSEVAVVELIPVKIDSLSCSEIRFWSNRTYYSRNRFDSLSVVKYIEQ